MSEVSLYWQVPKAALPGSAALQHNIGLGGGTLNPQPLHEYIAHKKQPPPLGSPDNPRYSPAVGSYDEGDSYERTS